MSDYCHPDDHDWEETGEVNEHDDCPRCTVKYECSECPARRWSVERRQPTLGDF